jgi:hypothetical protein
MPTFDLIVTASWVGVLTMAILIEAVLLYIRHRLSTRSAASAARLADAISFPPGGRDGLRSTAPSAIAPTQEDSVRTKASGR